MGSAMSATPAPVIPKPGKVLAPVKQMAQSFSQSIQHVQQPNSAPASNPLDPTSLSYNSGPVTPDLHLAAAAMYESQNLVQDARAQYELALKIDNSHREALIGLGRLLHRQGEHTNAIAVYEVATKAHPSDAVILNDLGLCYGRTGDTTKALEVLQQAITLQPDSELYRNNLAAILVQADQPEAAVQVLAEVHGAAIANYNVGFLLNQRGLANAAQPYLAKSLEFDPNLIEARTILAQIQPRLSALPTTAHSNSATVPPTSNWIPGSQPSQQTASLDRVNPVQATQAMADDAGYHANLPSILMNATGETTESKATSDAEESEDEFNLRMDSMVERIVAIDSNDKPLGLERLPESGVQRADYVIPANERDELLQANANSTRTDEESFDWETADANRELADQIIDIPSSSDAWDLDGEPHTEQAEGVPSLPIAPLPPSMSKRNYGLYR
ncbi:MAG: tetratricopeptide repeat protein [Planctomycetales bacterium]|nr:tetratricopeptide repeat protein [Planctomycetales bacterium]